MKSILEARQANEIIPKVGSSHICSTKKPLAVRSPKNKLTIQNQKPDSFGHKTVYYYITRK